MKQPKKWREGIDPFKIQFEKFKLVKVLGYPFARNDVFYCKGEITGKIVFCFLKVAKNGDLRNEIEKLENIKFKKMPLIIEYDSKNFSYLVTKKINGEKLSTIVGNNANSQSLDYLFEYGKTEAEIHDLNVNSERAIHRKFFDIPSEEFCGNYGLNYVRDWLIKNKPTSFDYCFCHGDLHYANLLWRKGHIVGILDWELAGENIREYDVAWCLILRPEQKFMNTKEELKMFIKGYLSVHSLNLDYVRYYMIQIYLYFYQIGYDKVKYREYIIDIFKKYCV